MNNFETLVYHPPFCSLGDLITWTDVLILGSTCICLHKKNELFGEGNVILISTYMQVMTTDYVKNHLKAFEVQFMSYPEWSMTINTRNKTNEIGTWHTDSDKWLIIWLAKTGKSQDQNNPRSVSGCVIYCHVFHILHQRYRHKKDQ